MKHKLEIRKKLSKSCWAWYRNLRTDLYLLMSKPYLLEIITNFLLDVISCDQMIQWQNDPLALVNVLAAEIQFWRPTARFSRGTLDNVPISSFPQNLKPKNNNKGSSYFSSCSMNIDNGFQFIICASSIINCEPGINCDLSISSRLSEEILFIKFCNTNIHLLPICRFFYASHKEDLECGTLESRGFCKL